ncbi:MAG: hypothetical protein NZM09_10195 [Ignavibacterium sp.]|nr:hypothetical protein [Ignavibacterium sp.]MDW8376049.1 hypothetical protein [Ignavibacteriales bacterium]
MKITIDKEETKTAEIEMVEIKKDKGNNYVETPCQCGCGIMIRTMVRKFLNSKHYGKTMKKDI